MKFLMIGLGSIGQGMLPLLKAYFNPQSIHIVTAHRKGLHIAQEYGATADVLKLTPKNYLDILNTCDFDILINVSVDVSSIDLIKWCQAHDKLYIDTCIEPWSGGYAIADREKTTNYYMRNEALKLKGKKTAVMAHGANPGLVSHFVKAALDELKDFFQLEKMSHSQMLHDLGIKVIQIAEKDTQISTKNFSPQTFINTWSVTGLTYEAEQCAELGTQEALDNLGSYQANDCSFGDIGKYLNQPGYKTKVISWVPSAGEQQAYLITHHESLSISEKFSYNNWRPTVYFAYKPCPQALEKWHLLGTPIKSKKILRDEITSGHDELGVLLISEHFSYWFGSILNCKQVDIPYNSATSLQVTISIIAAIAWMIENPNEGLCEAEDMNHHFILDIAKPYLGEFGGVFADFKPKSLEFKDFLVP